MDFKEFENTVRGFFPDITDKKLEQFRALGPLYEDWNSKINVISRKDIDSLYLHHVLHSLAIAEYIRLNLPELYAMISVAPGKNTGTMESPKGAPETSDAGKTPPAEIANPDGSAGDFHRTFLDLGTGGGFPGIPLAIMFPSAHFTLCDSVGKKILVAEAVARACGLENVTTVNARAESLTGKYDYIVSRAVTSLDKFMPWVRGKYGKGIFYLKGGDVVEEIAETMGRFRLPKGSVHVWKIDGKFADPYFEGKLVIFIEEMKNQRK